MIKGVILDLDGTLLDSMEIWDSIIERYLIAEGYEPTEDLSQFAGSMSMRQACELVKKTYGMQKTTDELLDGIVSMAGDYYRYEVSLKPGAEAFLKGLRENGVAICAATANDRALAEPALEHNGVLEYFLKVFSCNDLHCSKDEPTVYRTAARFMGFKDDEVMVFEDSLHALLTAKNAGFQTAAVFDAHEKAQDVMKETADLYLETLAVPVSVVLG